MSSDDGPSVQVLARDLTPEDKKKLIDEIFTEWEDGVNREATQPSKDDHGDMLKCEEPSYGRNMSSQRPRLGRTRQMVMQVEKDAQKQETMEKKMRRMHALEEPSYTHMRAPRPRRRRDGEEWDREVDRTFTVEEEHRQTFTDPGVVVPESSRSESPEVSTPAFTLSDHPMTLIELGKAFDRLQKENWELKRSISSLKRRQGDNKES